MDKLIESLIKLKDSLIDFAQEDLESAVWAKNKEGNYFIRPEVEEKIWDILAKYPEENVKANAESARITGSMCTNQYVEKTDIDVHITPKDTSQWDEKRIKGMQIWFDKNRDKIGGYIGKHPIEFYIQTNIAQDYLSDGVYDLLNHKWLKGPKLVPLDYDPYEDFSDIANDLRSSVEDADKLFGELKRDVIDYEVISQAIGRMSPEQQKHFLTQLESKLQEIEDDIEAMYRLRKRWVDARKLSSAPTTPEQALNDIELAKKWRDTNALFKFVGRYRYLKTIGDLKKLISDDGKITPDEVDIIKRTIGVNDGI